MREGWSVWTRNLGAAAAAVTLGALTVGCGTYEPEPEYPQNAVQYVQAPPPAADPQMQTQAQMQAPPQGQPQDPNGEVALGVDPNEQEYSDTDPSALTEFKPVLEDHGKWVDDGTYGTVWVPAASEVGTDFQPYVSAGHWTYSDDTDYTWVSDYSWGWAPFHYGRWVTLPGYGWSWIPGRRYAGAWVSWRYGAGYDYVGWAPMGPSYYWWHGAPYGWNAGWYDYHDHYAFCERGHLYGGSSYVVRGPAAHEHFGRTTDYVAAHPTVGGPGRVIAHPGVGRGPRPNELGNANVVVATPKSNMGLARASAFATPRTAVMAGAAAPASFNSGRGPATMASVPRPGGNGAVASSPSYTQGGAPYRGAPQVNNNQVARPVAGFGGPSYASQSVVRAQPQPQSINHGNGPVMQGRPTPAVRSPSLASPGNVRSAPVVRSAPSVRSAGSMPSVSHSMPSVSHSSPSVSHSSSPARSAPSTRRR